MSTLALVNSGAAGNLISPGLAPRLYLPFHWLPTPIAVQAIDGRSISGGSVIHLIGPIELMMGNHHKHLFVLIQSLINDVLRDMLGKFVSAYIDDIIIYSQTRTQLGPN